MKTMKKYVGLTIAALMINGSVQGYETQYQEYAGGAGYVESREAPGLAPALALGAIALTAIIAVAVQNSNNGHGHCH